MLGVSGSLSSIEQPARPAATAPATVLVTSAGSRPNPFSRSADTGTSTAATIRRALSTISDPVSSPTSGRPISEAVVPKPVM